MSTRVFYMDQGGVHESGTPAEIFNHPKCDRTRNFVGQVCLKQARDVIRILREGILRE